MTQSMLLSLVISALVLAIAASYLMKGKRRATDYYSYFTIGVAWFILGIASRITSLVILGLIFSYVGLAHKDKWEKNKKDWSELGKKEKIMILAIGSIALVAGGVVAAILVFLAMGR